MSGWRRERDDVIGGGEREKKRLMGNSKISNAVFYYSIETDAYSLTIGLAWNSLVVWASSARRIYDFSLLILILQKESLSLVWVDKPQAW